MERRRCAEQQPNCAAKRATALSRMMTGIAVAALALLAGCDLWLTRKRREALPAQFQAAWLRLCRGRMWDVFVRTAQGVRAVSSRALGAQILSIRFVTGSLLASALLAAVVLATTALVLKVTMQDPVAHFLRYFASVTVFSGWICAWATAATLDALRYTQAIATRILAPLAHLLGACLLCLLALHAGTWLEYQQIRTPLPYASEWFYADVYLRYLREPGGRSVTLAVSAGVLWSFLIAWSVLLATVLARILRPMLQPATTGVLRGLQRLPHGLLAAAAVVASVALVAT